jgi:hypothetical protein
MAPRRGGRPVPVIMAMLGVLALVVLVILTSAPVSHGRGSADARHALLAVRWRTAIADANDASPSPGATSGAAGPLSVATSPFAGHTGGTVSFAALDSTGVAAPSPPVYETTVPVDPPATLDPILPSDLGVDAPPQCNARAHTEYDGIAVKCAAAWSCATALCCALRQWFPFPSATNAPVRGFGLRLALELGSSPPMPAAGGATRTCYLTRPPAAPPATNTRGKRRTQAESHRCRATRGSSVRMPR